MENICVRIKDRREDERPYEKCRQLGPESLTDVELLAVLLRTGTKDMDVLSLSSAILNGHRSYEGTASILHYSFEELLDIKGIGPVKAVQIQCLGELVGRIWRSNVSSNRVSFKDAISCATYYTQKLRFLEKEEVTIAYVDFQNRLISDEVMTRGTDRSSLVSVRDILEGALKHHASGILLVHNHPYGQATPSEADYEVTKRVCQGAKAIGIEFLDHIIIGERGYYSFKERGWNDD